MSSNGCDFEHMLRAVLSVNEDPMTAHVFLADADGEKLIPCRFVFYDRHDNLVRFVENDEWSTTYRPDQLIGYWIELGAQ